MNGIDVIKKSLEMSQGWMMGLIADMKDAPLTAPTPNGGNHPMWCIGHLTFSEGQLVNQFIKGEANPVADWQGVFGQGTQPSDDASIYPSFDEVVAKFEELRGGTLAQVPH